MATATAIALNTISPLRAISSKTLFSIISIQLVVLSLMWVFSGSPMMPMPGEVWEALSDQFAAGFAYHIGVSLLLNFEAIILATIISLLISYSTVIPFFRPIATMSTKLRFLSMAGLSVAFAMSFHDKHTQKLAMMAFSISVFFITSMLDVIATIPREQYDLSRTLRMSEWRVVWEVVVLGQMDRVFDVLRQNVAIGWMMLTMVETIAYAEGGIGTVLQTMQLHARFSDLMAIQIVVMFLGLTQDYLIGVAKNFFCPYANLTMEKH